MEENQSRGSSRRRRRGLRGGGGRGGEGSEEGAREEGGRGGGGCEEGAREGGGFPPMRTGQCGRARSAQKLMLICTNFNTTRLGHAPGRKAQVVFVICQEDH